MYGYQAPMMRGGYPTQGQPHPHAIHVPPNTPAPNGQGQNTARSRLRLSQTTVTVVPSVLACMLVQAVAAFFYVTSVLTFYGAVNNARGFSEDPSHDGNVLYIVFSVFTAVAAAMCAPMILNSGYSTLIIGGSVLMMFSTLSSSVVTAAEILVIPYSVFGACAYGLLKTGPQVAMLDFLNNRRGLAAGLSYLGVTIGQLAGVIIFTFTDMVHNANYDGSGNATWPNNLRIIEVGAVISLMSAAMIRKPSFTTGSWPELFQYVPFYILCFANFCVSLGFGLLDMVYSNLPGERDFESHPSGAHEIFTVSFIAQMVEFAAVILLLIIIAACCKDGVMKKAALLVTAIFVAVLAAGSYVNKLTYKDFEIFVVYGGVAGFIKALVRVCLPIAMITYTGRLNYKIGLPFLELSGGLGQLVSYIIQEETDMPSDEPLETGWYIAAGFFTAAAIVCLIAHCIYLPWEDAVTEAEDDDTARGVRAIENAAFTPDDSLGALDVFGDFKP